LDFSTFREAVVWGNNQGSTIALCSLWVALFFTACSITTVVKRGEPFERKALTTVVMHDGEARVTSFVKAVGDSLVVSDDSSEPRVPLAQAVRLEYVSKARGVASGFLIGPLVGLGIGVVVGSTPAGECDPGGGACIFGGPGGMGVFMGIMGLFVGPIMGGQVGAKVSVLFDTTASVPQAPEAGGRMDGYSR
jgi:hypothetical protein